MSTNERAELRCMVNVFCACMETRILPCVTSPCYKTACKMVGRKRMKEHAMDEVTKRLRERVEDIAREQGMIQAWTHMGYILRSCVKAHRATLRELKKGNVTP